jgi:hypothetical protein
VRRRGRRSGRRSAKHGGRPKGASGGEQLTSPAVSTVVVVAAGGGRCSSSTVARLSVERRRYALVATAHAAASSPAAPGPMQVNSRQKEPMHPRSSHANPTVTSSADWGGGLILYILVWSILSVPISNRPSKPLTPLNRLVAGFV